jgi:hypothetical protein
MPHLIEPPRLPCTVVSLRGELLRAHRELVKAAKAWPGRNLSDGAWGATAKRALVEVEEFPPLIRKQSQPLQEVVNQIATVERLIGALTWAETAGFTEVRRCHPTTSSGDHDLVVESTDRLLGVFEVSDVSGVSGNGNQKMAADIRTLVTCRCDFCERAAKKYLATSPTSAEWLRRLIGDRDRMGKYGLVDLVVHGPVEPDTFITELNGSVSS